MTRILIAGETLIDFIADKQGPITAVKTFHRRAGGAPANVSVALARLDDPPLFWTRVGDDSFGDYLIETLTKEDISPTYLERDSEAGTTLVFVSLDPEADRSFSFHRDGTADTRLQPSTVSDTTIESLEWVHTGGSCWPTNQVERRLSI